jgi:hypothetical protein
MGDELDGGVPLSDGEGFQSRKKIVIRQSRRGDQQLLMHVPV